MIPYTLSPGEVAFARAVTQAREDHNVGVPEQKQTNRESKANRLDSYGAELAVAALCNRYPDVSTYIQKGRADLYLGHGQTADVKHTTWPNGNLICQPSKAASPASIYILVVGELPHYEVIGYATAGELFVPTNLTTFLGNNPNPVYFMYRGDLHELSRENMADPRWLDWIADQVH